MASEHKFQVTFLQGLARVSDWLPRALVPHDHRAGAVLATRNIAFETQVVDRVILGVNGEPFLTDHETGTSRHRPALKHAVKLKPQVIVHPARVMFLHHEPQTRGRFGSWFGVGLRFGGAAEVALLLVTLQRRR